MSWILILCGASEKRKRTFSMKTSHCAIEIQVVTVDALKFRTLVDFLQ